MSRIESAQRNQKLMRVNVPVLPAELARLKLSMLAKEAWYYMYIQQPIHAYVCW